MSNALLSNARILTTLLFTYVVVAFAAQPATAQTAKKLNCKGCVKSKQLKNNGVKSKDIKDGQVMSGDLADSAVTGAKIQDDAVTPGKLSAAALAGGRQPIEDCGTIDQPGSYVLLGDLPGPLGLEPDGGCLVIAADDVTLDLNGFSIVGDGTGTGHGIFLDGRVNVEVRNGTVSNFPSDGIFEFSDSAPALRHHLDNLRITFNGGDGVDLRGLLHQVTNCYARGNGSVGIRSDRDTVVAGNTSESNGGGGIRVASGSVTGNLATRNTGTGIFAIDSAISGNKSIRSSGDGIVAGLRSAVSGNEAIFNQLAGIVISGPGTLTGNMAISNSGSGIDAGDGVTVTGNTATDNGENGIILGGNNLVDGNTAGGNNTSAGGFVNITACGAGVCLLGDNRTF